MKKEHIIPVLSASVLVLTIVLASVKLLSKDENEGGCSCKKQTV